MEEERLVIEGRTEKGEAFRPSDWIERLSSALATFGPDQHLRYSSYAFPCMIQGEKCLVIKRDLATIDPAAYEFVLKFARENLLRIQPDRREQRRDVPQERRKG